MTTPEKFRRRQRIEGLGLLFLGLMVAATGVQGYVTDQHQNECITDQVTALTQAVDARDVFADRDAAATRDVIAGAIEAKSEADFARIFANYRDAQATLTKDRQDHPVPPFPTGQCG